MKFKLEKCKKLKTNNTSGITLIALVVTIVVLLILAGITINMLFSENGIITKAKEASEKTAKAEENDIKGMENIVSDIDKILDEVNKGQNVKTITEILAQTQAAETNQNAVDTYGNKVLIPAGFKIVPHGTDGAEYKYSGDNVPAVQDGIVIENEEDENQFVWIPVGEIKNKDNTTTEITLGRYTFDIGEWDDTNNVYTGTGKETLVQAASNYSNVNIETEAGKLVDEYDYEYYELLSTESGLSEYGNAVAKDLESFITNAIKNGGYYIARYEASKNGEKAASKISTGTPAGYEGTVSDGMLWNNITQPDAATAAKAMYENENYESDLINSYAWNTAIVFIQKYADSDYSKEIAGTFSTELQNTGTNGDKVCNIYDMAGNVAEWSTEYCTDSDDGGTYPCVFRGGGFDGNGLSAGSRISVTTSDSFGIVGFRALLDCTPES